MSKCPSIYINVYDINVSGVNGHRKRLFQCSFVICFEWKKTITQVLFEIMWWLKLKHLSVFIFYSWAVLERLQSSEVFWLTSYNCTTHAHLWVATFVLRHLFWNTFSASLLIFNKTCTYKCITSQSVDMRKMPNWFLHILPSVRGLKSHLVCFNETV